MLSSSALSAAVTLAPLQHNVAFSPLAFESIAQIVLAAVLVVAHSVYPLPLALSVAAVQAFMLVPHVLFSMPSVSLQPCSFLADIISQSVEYTKWVSPVGK